LGRTIILHELHEETATGKTKLFPVQDLKEIRAAYLKVTAVSGTLPTLDVTIENVLLMRDAYGAYSYEKADTLITFTQFTATGDELKTAYDTGKTFWGNFIRLTYTLGGTSPKFTFSVVVEGK